MARQSKRGSGGEDAGDGDDADNDREAGKLLPNLRRRETKTKRLRRRERDGENLLPFQDYLRQVYIVK